MLIWLVIIPVAGGIISWASNMVSGKWPRWMALFSLTAELVLTIALCASLLNGGAHTSGSWLTEVRLEWLPQLGITFHLAVDGLSLLLLALTALLGIMAVLSAWVEIQERTGFFYFNLLFTLSGITGIFLALDLFLFYFSWEMMLVPMYLLIALWGHENRTYASIKFFLFTQLSGLLMLTAILGLFFVHGQATGVYTFDYMELLGTPMGPHTGMMLMLGFLAAFFVKLPVVPFHTWLADAHTEAPTAASVILAGLLLKTGAYGLIRFAVPLFPEVAARLSPVVMVLAVAGILYGAVLAFAQTDLKRVVAYTSISHMGFVLIGVFAWNEIALQGAVVQMICHGISTGALFMLVGFLQERIQTRDLRRMGGLWATLPRMGGLLLFFALASMGLPGLGNFIGEFLVLLGTYKASVTATAFAAGGFILSTLYALRMVTRVVFNGQKETWMIPDLKGREIAATGVLVVALVWIGVFPQFLMNAAAHGFLNLEQYRHGTVETGNSNLRLKQCVCRDGKRVCCSEHRGRLGTMPMNRSVPAARPRLGRPELSEGQAKFEGRAEANRSRVSRPQREQEKLVSHIDPGLNANWNKGPVPLPRERIRAHGVTRPCAGCTDCREEHT